MATREKIEELKKIIRKEAELCDSEQMPYVCAIVNDEKTYPAMEKKILKIIAEKKCSVNRALLEIEKMYNYNIAE